MTAAALMLGLAPTLQAAAQEGTATEVWALEGFSAPSSADLEYLEGDNLAIIPMMMGARVVAYRIE